MVPAAVSPPGAQAVTLAVRGKTRTVDMPPNATVAALFAAVEDELEPSTIKMLCRGKRLAPGDAIPADAKIMVLGTTRAEKETVRSAKSDPLLRGFAAEEAKEAMYLEMESTLITLTQEHAMQDDESQGLTLPDAVLSEVFAAGGFVVRARGALISRDWRHVAVDEAAWRGEYARRWWHHGTAGDLSLIHI